MSMAWLTSWVIRLTAVGWSVWRPERASRTMHQCRTVKSGQLFLLPKCTGGEGIQQG